MSILIGCYASQFFINVFYIIATATLIFISSSQSHFARGVIISCLLGRVHAAKLAIQKVSRTPGSSLSMPLESVVTARNVQLYIHVNYM